LVRDRARRIVVALGLLWWTGFGFGEISPLTMPRSGVFAREWGVPIYRIERMPRL